jgi:uncharacterized protein (DUF362 family)
MFDNKVDLVLTSGWYPEKSPFNPSKRYPEYPYHEIDEDNHIYGAVRELLIKLNLDKENYGTKKWNPLGSLIKPGEKVVLKPNFVSEPKSEDVDYMSIITHSSIIRPIIDYCQIALQGEGELTIADAPQFDSNFEKIKKITKIDDMIQYLNKNSPIKINLVDLRQERVEIENGIITKKIFMDGDPKGSTIINLKEKSAFNPVEIYSNKFYGADYDFEETRRHHSDGNHEYCISNTILDADVIINIPKLKTHKKAGITVCLKNLVGINTNKNYIPHYRFGSKEEGGDEYPEIIRFKSYISSLHQFLLNLMSKMTPNQRKIMKPFGNFYLRLGNDNPFKFESGNWHGNDTIWRTIIDLNKILFFAKKDGTLSNEIQRKYFAIVDGIIGGEGDGPLFPTSKPCGLLIGGFDPVSVDLISAEIMGFDWNKIPSIKNSKSFFTKNELNYENISKINFEFKPPKNWENIINRENKI